MPPSLRNTLSALGLALFASSASMAASNSSPAAAPSPPPQTQTQVQAATAPTPSASSAAALPSAADEVAGVLKKVQGSVSLRSGSGTARPSASGAAMAVGERIHTGKDSGASLTLSDGTELMLGARSSVVLREYRFNSTTHEGNILLDFIGGQLRVISGLISKQNPENLKVKTPTAVVGVRGTDFILEAAHVDE